MLTASSISQYFLYGAAQNPANLINDSLIRSSTLETDVYVSRAEYTQAAGYFAVGAQFGVVKSFFDTSIALAPGHYSMNAGANNIFTKLGITDTSAATIFNFQQYDYKAPFESNQQYAERTYIYNTTQFGIRNTADFVVDANGTRHIENLTIAPYEDNFDFTSSNGLASYANLFLQPQIDPSNIGRTVNIKFTTETIGELASQSYDSTQYSLDTSNITFWKDSAPILSLPVLIQELSNDLFGSTSGVTRFLDADARPIIYGTLANDTMDAYLKIDITKTPKLIDYASNGVALVGGAGNDTLTGFIYNDRLYGGIGNDNLSGGGGDDTLYGGGGMDIVNGGSGYDTLSYENSPSAANVNFVTGAVSGGDAGGDSISGIENFIGSSFNDTVVGDTGANTIDGALGNDSISAGGGDDLLIGGGGADVLNGDAGIDTASYSKSAAAVNVNLAVSAQTGGDAAGDVLSNIENVTGSAFNDTLAGNALNNHIVGGAGNDTLSGGTAGTDLLQGGAGNDTYMLNVGTARTVTIDDVDGRVNLDFGTLKILITDYPYSSSTYLGKVIYLYPTAQIGSPTGYGDSIGLQYDDASRSIKIFTVPGNPSNVSSNSVFTQIGEIRNVASYSSAAVPLDPLPATIDPTLVPSVPLAVNYTYSGYTGTGDAENNTIAGGSSNDSISGGDGNDNLSGAAGNDTLSGGNGSDYLDGGAGNDSLVGGDGNDTYAIDSASDVIVENAGAGADTVLTALSYILGTNLENVTLANNGLAINATGNSLNNIVTGNTANNVLVGGAGADTINGGAGFDRADYAASTTAVNVNLATNINAGGDAAGDIIYNVEQIAGSALNDTLTGGVADDSLIGMAGNDSITGGAGNDTLEGGIGNDTLLGGDGNDKFIGGLGSDYVDGGTGIDTLSFEDSSTWVSADLGINNFWNGDAAWDNVVNVENLTGSAFNDLLYGNAGANILDGGVGSDRLTGADGNDTLIGGDGNDTLLGGNGDDKIVGGLGSDSIDGGAGIDTLSFETSTTWVSANLEINNFWNGDAAWDSVTNVENLTGSAFNDFLTGNATANLLNGALGNDSINGGDGNDTLMGGDGNDTLLGGNGDDSIIGGFGSDYVDGGAGIDTLSFETSTTWVSADLNINNFWNGEAAWDNVTNVENLSGSAFNDFLYGNASSNALNGGAGNDVINGRAGSDVLTGGAGNDTFTFAALADSSKTVTDRITDFTVGQDKISVQGLGFTGLVAGAATGSLLGFTYDSVANKTTISAVSDFKIILDGNVALTSSHFIY